MSEYTAKTLKKDSHAGVRDVVTTFSWLRYTRLWQKSVSLHGIRQ